ncbi:MAG: MATE family efflux transporter [Mycoplasmataceae bacterium]|nr:MATE family efflux transporter [Mycoplasmataceae bacterium]
MYMLEKIKKSFPNDIQRWKLFTITSLPVVFAAMIFALNSFIDNFMAIPIPNGIDKLSYANTWTSLVAGIIAATTIVGSTLFGQYYGANDKVNTRFVLRARMLIALLITMVFAIPAFIFPESMIQLVGSNKISPLIANDSALYLRIIAVTWITGAWGYTSAMIMREAGHGKASLFSSIISLSINVILNSIFVFTIGEIWSLALSTIISQFFSVGFNIIFVWVKNKKIVINPMKLFAISPQIWKQIFKRSSSFLFLVVGSIAVSVRFIFWNVEYYPGQVGGNHLFQLSAATILGISGAIFNIFWSTFESIGANTTIFVGKELGHGNITQAKKNANELQGFHFIMAIIMGLCLLIFSFIIPHMTFLADGYRSGTIEWLLGEGKPYDEAALIADRGVIEYLSQLKMTIWPLAAFMPMWIWYITRSRCISAGGNTNITAGIDALTGLIQTCWISIIIWVIIPATNLPFPVAYAIFFLFDLFKVFIYDILFNKYNWAKNLTLETKTPESIVMEVMSEGK